MKKRKMALCMILFGVLLFCTGCGKKMLKENKELNILAAASMTDVLEEIAGMYQKEVPDVELTFHFESSGILKNQIEQGAPADIFLPAAMRQMEELNRAGLIKEDSIVKLLENKVVLIQPSDSKTALTSFEDAASNKVMMVAVGNAEVPVGQYTEEIYRSLGLWEEILAKANLASNVRQVLDWVATGNADCGIVYATDAMIERNVTIVSEAPEGSCEKVIYPAGIVKSSTHAEEAEDFLAYLQTDEVKKVFEVYGFTICEE